MHRDIPRQGRRAHRTVSIRVRDDGWADSRDIAASFARRHHNVLSAIDLVLRDCPEAVLHVRFDQHPVTAGLGGTRHVRHAKVDRTGFMLLAMAMPSTMRGVALNWAMAFERGESAIPFRRVD